MKCSEMGEKWVKSAEKWQKLGKKRGGQKKGKMAKKGGAKIGSNGQKWVAVVVNNNTSIGAPQTTTGPHPKRKNNRHGIHVIFVMLCCGGGQKWVQIDQKKRGGGLK